MKRPPSRLSTPALKLIVRSYLRRLGAETRTDRVKVVFNTRLRTAIGRSDPGRHRIYLNPHLIDRHPEELVPTIVHELCHLLAGYDAGHGPRWRELMRRCGFSPEAYHDLDVTGLERQTWRWSCRLCGAVYLRKHRAAHHFLCGHCGGSLELRTAGRRAAREARAVRGRRSR